MKSFFYAHYQFYNYQKINRILKKYCFSFLFLSRTNYYHYHLAMMQPDYNLLQGLLYKTYNLFASFSE